MRTLADVRVGDVVGIVSENRLEFPAALFASIFLGATVAPINLTYSEGKCYSGGATLYSLKFYSNANLISANCLSNQRNNQLSS